MGLFDVAIQNPEQLRQYSVEQAVAICGEGKLLDGSMCQKQFRMLLSSIDSDLLSEYADRCLDGGFSNSGFVLQDIVNEIGRRLGYKIEPGLYRGKPKQIGYDGLWIGPSEAHVVEVKTTDAYRVNLDTIRAYASKAANVQPDLPDAPTVLLVVGRQDTGDLEAQVRGSQHAWSVRLVSVDSLIKLMYISEELAGSQIDYKIKSVLKPFEYTRVDGIIDLVFEAQQETDMLAQTEEELDDEQSEGGDSISVGSKNEITPREQIDKRRFELVEPIYKGRNLEYGRKSRAQFRDPEDNLRVACTISKRYKIASRPYWYAFHKKWLEFLKDANEGLFVLGCMDRKEGFAIPVQEMDSYIDSLDCTERPDGQKFWHIDLAFEGDDLYWNLPKIGKKISLEPYRVCGGQH